MSVEDEKQKVFQGTPSEDVRLENLGYEQELKRSFGLIGMIGFSFSVVTSWTALSGVFIVGVTSGGPPVMVFSFLAVSLLTLAVAIPMAEMCSMYPVAGGQYSWVAALAPPKIARGLSYVTGWFMLIGLLAMGATNNSIASNFVLGMGNLVFPEFEIQRWQTVLVAYLVAFLSAAINLWGSHFLHRISKAILIWNVTSFVIVTATILAMNDHKQPASFVFQDFQNGTGFSTGMAAIIGVLQACFGMCCYDAPSHMTEEMKSASKEAPKAIVLAVILGAVTGFAFLVTLCFCIGDIETTANTSTGVPVIQIIYDSTGSKVATCILSSLISVIVIVAGNNILAEGSRSVYAFARDNGLPFSKFFSKVESKTHVPVNAVLLTLVVQLALDAIEFGTTTGFETVIAISTEGFYLSYAIALFSRLAGYCTGHVTKLDGPYSFSVPVSVALNIIGLLFLLFAAITFNFPSENPVTHQSMNYTSAAIGVVALISGITWITTGRKHFSGPGANRVWRSRLRNETNVICKRRTCELLYRVSFASFSLAPQYAVTFPSVPGQVAGELEATLYTNANTSATGPALDVAQPPQMFARTYINARRIHKQVCTFVSYQSLARKSPSMSTYMSLKADGISRDTNESSGSRPSTTGHGKTQYRLVEYVEDLDRYCPEGGGIILYKSVTT
ncbi:hypothetical protein VN97_g8432 [Penicillium thymicola]|uniref:GABA permease n=1 Tax=Penicillium thymicola TaxID=293382 RepID=A0AAI9X5Y6_PENTH|nr:hypothetical protein VN97_g8432 [Penicillium thymicola]